LRVQALSKRHGTDARCNSTASIVRTARRRYQASAASYAAATRAFGANFWNERSSGWFTADTFGIAYPHLATRAVVHLADDDAHAVRSRRAASIDRSVARAAPKTMYLMRHAKLVADTMQGE
jgi:hypothetical protein